MVQIDASGSGGLVDPGVACWVGISGELGAREESGMSAWQFAVMKLARALLRLVFDRSFQCPVHSGRKWYTLLINILIKIHASTSSLRLDFILIKIHLSGGHAGATTSSAEDLEADGGAPVVPRPAQPCPPCQVRGGTCGGTAFDSF